ncbi:hypothetical protein Dimus_016842 [Dionaea muscipula]
MSGSRGRRLEATHERAATSSAVWTRRRGDNSRDIREETEIRCYFRRDPAVWGSIRAWVSGWRVESWIMERRSRMSKISSPPQIRCPAVKWPPWSDDRERRKKIREEYERRRMQLRDLRLALKAESVSDLQDILFACFSPSVFTRS